MNPDYINRYKKHIWTDANGVLIKVTVMTNNYLDYVIKILEQDPDEIINGYKAKDWLPIMLAEYAVRMNNISKNTVKTVMSKKVIEVVPFPVAWNCFEPIMNRPNEREYYEPPLVEYSETIYGKYHCVVELDIQGYHFGYVGVRENHPAYKQNGSAISTLVHGGITHTTHQVATFRVPYMKMWYFAIRFDHEEDYPDVPALDKYKEYWAGTHAYDQLEDKIKKYHIAPGTLKGQGYFTIKDLEYVKQQLVQLVLDLEQYEKDKANNATIKVAPF